MVVNNTLLAASSYYCYQCLWFVHRFHKFIELSIFSFASSCVHFRTAAVIRMDNFRDVQFALVCIAYI